MLGDPYTKAGCDQFHERRGDPGTPPDQTEAPLLPTLPPLPAPTESAETSIPPPPVVPATIEAHAGFDRVTVEFGRPCENWQVQYVGEAIAYRTGEVVRVSGRAILEVRFNGCTGSPEPVSNAAAQVVTEVRRAACRLDDFATQMYIGVDA